MADQPVSLSVVKAERDEKDRTWAKRELLKWIEETLPDDILGWALCAVGETDDKEEIVSYTRITGNTVKDYALAHHLGVVRLMQYQARN